LARRVFPGGGRRGRGRASAGRAGYAEGMKKLMAGDEGAALGHFRSMAAARPRDPYAHSGMGAALMSCGRAKEALASFRKALDLGDDMADTRLNMGAVCRTLRMPGESLKCYRDALAMAPDSAEVRVSMSYVYHDLEMYGDAADSAGEALRLDPGCRGAKAARGVALLRMGKYGEAAGVLREAVAADPGSRIAQSGLGGALFFEGDAEGALECFEAAARISPSDAGAHFRAGLVLAKLGEHGRAYDAFAEAARLEKTPQSLAGMAISLVRAHEGGAPGPWSAEAAEAADGALAMDSGWAGAHYAKALLLEAQGKDSKYHRDEAARLDPEHGGDPSVDYAESDPRQIRMEIGVQMLAGNVAGAISCLKALTSEEPGFADGHIALSAALRASGDARAARAELERAVENSDGVENAYRSVANVFGRMGLEEEAAKFGRMADEAGSGPAAEQIRRAEKLMIGGKRKEAMGAADEALKAQPGHATASAIKGIALAEQGRFSESIPPLLDVVRSVPDSAPAHRQLGQSYISSGDAEGALRHFGEAARLDPDDRWGHHGVGDALGQLGRFREAYEAYARASGIEPHAKTYSNMSVMLLHMNTAGAGPDAPAVGEEWRDEALALVDKAMELDAKYPYPHYAKSLILRASGDERGADECLRRLKKMDPALYRKVA